MNLSFLPSAAWLWGILAAGVAAFATYEHFHLIREGEAKAVAAVKVSSAKAEKAAEDKIAALNKSHADDIAELENTYENMLKTADGQHASDLARLRAGDSYAKAHPLLGGATGGESTEGSGAGSPSRGSTEFERLEQVAAELADSTRRLNVSLTICQSDRDALTGK